LRKGLSIKGEAFSTVECEYIVYEGAEGHRCGSVLPTKVPDKDTSDAGLLLASLFPGITCDPFGLTRPPDTPTPPGMGLYFITNAAVTVFGGRINLRCGREELQVSRPKRERPLGRETFNVRLRTHPMSSWINGNLLWVELPVSSPTAARPARELEIDGAAIF